jgi:site-specific DNA recombinase
MARDFIEQAHLGDLTGMNFAGLVRLSFETGSQDRERKVIPLTGRDIRGRDEQAKDCRTYVEKRGGAYVYTYEESDTSAYKRKRVRLPDGRTVYRVIRPVFEGALEDLKRGTIPDGQRIDGLIVYDIDRLTRDNRHLEDAIEVVHHFRRPIIDITGTLDLLTDNGRTVARIVVATANKQSADTSRRVSRKHKALQQAGIPTGGPRPFGWHDDKRTVNEREAEAIRHGVKRILEGAPVLAVVADWNKSGLSTPRGNKWVKQSALVVLRNPRLCGYRSRMVRPVDPDTNKEASHWEIVRDENGDPVIGQWESILSVAEWEAVTAIIGGKARPERGVNARKYLLSGILRCGKDGCGARLRGFRRVSGDNSYHSYQCQSSGLGGCGGTFVSGAKADEYVTEAVIAKFELEAQRRAVETEPAAWPGEEELDAVRQQLRELTAAWRGRKISGERYFALLSSLEEEEQRLSNQRNQWLATVATNVNRPLTIRDDWEGYTLAEKRAYIEEALIAVIVFPNADRKKWDPDARMRPVWRES